MAACRPCPAGGRRQGVARRAAARGRHATTARGAAWWWKITTLGLLNIGAFFALLFVAAYHLPGGVAATLGAVQPLIVAALSHAFLAERMTGRTLLTGLAGLAGIALLVLRGDAALDVTGVAAGLMGAASMDGRDAAGFTYLVLVNTALAYIVWMRGISQLPATQITYLGLLSPISATLLGWMALGEVLTPLQLLGLVIALASVLAAQRALPRSRAAVSTGTLPAPPTATRPPAH